MKSRLPIIGRLARVWFPNIELNSEGVIAKIDTGSDSGAMHVVYSRLLRDEKGLEFVEFQPLHQDKPVIRTYKFKRVRVTSSNGTVERRFRVQFTIKIQGKTHPIELSLTDRSDMKYDVIIGRRFLEGKFLVDVSLANV